MSLSRREYARHRRAAGLPGGTPKAVRMAIAAGRIAAAPDGGIADAELADRQWAATTRADRVPHTGRGARATTATTATTTASAAPAASASPPAPSKLQLLREERETLAIERERFEFDKLRGKYMLVDEVRRQIVGDYTICRNLLLGVPNRIGQELDRDLALKVCPIADRLIRQSLETLADGIEEAQAALQREQAGLPVQPGEPAVDESSGGRT